jgi:hypothetical protein
MKCFFTGLFKRNSTCFKNLIYNMFYVYFEILFRANDRCNFVLLKNVKSF